MTRLWYDDTPDPMPCRLPPGIVERRGSIEPQPRSAMVEAEAQFAIGATNVAAHMIEQRARLYQSTFGPNQLDRDIPKLGASRMTGRQLVATAEHLLEHGGRDYGTPRDQRNLCAAVLHGQRMIETTGAAS